MNTKILASLVLIGIAISGITMGTVAYFNDVETSTGNTFTAGKLNLKVDDKCTFNGPTWTGAKSCNWELKDLDGELFFSFTDVKPGDHGENTISLHVYDNDACGSVKIIKTSDKDNGCNEPEKGDEPDCEKDDLGELDKNMNFFIWFDMCEATTGYPTAVPGDNIYQKDCDIELTKGTFDLSKYWSLGPLKASNTYYFGISWELPWATNNEAQSDSFSGDIIFEAVQLRHLDEHNGCPTLGTELTP